jgi:hypothetical protein
MRGIAKSAAVRACPPSFADLAVILAVMRRQLHAFGRPSSFGSGMTNWVPLVDALRTFLLDATAELRETIAHVWFTGTPPRHRLTQA